MAKKRGSPLLKKEAEIIAKKLEAEIDRSGPHNKAIIKYNGYIVGTFGWCHDKKKGNGNIPKNLGFSPHDILEMARCRYDRTDYLAWLKAKGELPNEPLDTK